MGVLARPVVPGLNTALRSMKIEFTIVGKPATAGSKRAFRLKTGRVVVTDDCARSKPWRQEVASAEKVLTNQFT